jgi:hypothetical protein
MLPDRERRMIFIADWATYPLRHLADVGRISKGFARTASRGGPDLSAETF